GVEGTSRAGQVGARPQKTDPACSSPRTRNRPVGSTNTEGGCHGLEHVRKSRQANRTASFPKTPQTSATAANLAEIPLQPVGRTSTDFDAGGNRGALRCGQN